MRNMDDQRFSIRPVGRRARSALPRADGPDAHRRRARDPAAPTDPDRPAVATVAALAGSRLADQGMLRKLRSIPLPTGELHRSPKLVNLTHFGNGCRFEEPRHDDPLRS